MARHRMVNGNKVMFTEAEEIARDAEEATALAARPLNKWKESIQATDGGMPRYLEDLITTNSLTMTSEMKTRYDAKIKLRATKP